MGMIFLFSSIPSSELPEFDWADWVIKKGGHALGYGLLAVSYWYAFGMKARHLWLAWVLSVAYAFSDEFHQSFVPGRHPSVTDVAIDASGAALVLLLVSMISKRKKPADSAGH